MSTPDRASDPTEDLLDEPDERETLERGDLARIRRFLSPFARRQKGLLLLMAAALLVETAFEVMFPLAQRHIIDNGLVERDAGVIVWVLVFLAVSAVVVNTLGLVVDYLYCRIAIGIVGDVREAMHDHLLRLQFEDHEDMPRGATLSRFAGDVQNIESALLEAVPWLIHPVLQVIYSTALMFYFNIWLGLLSALIFPIVLLLPRRLAQRAFAHSYDKRRREGTLLTHLQESLAAIAVMKAFGLERHRHRRYVRLTTAWRGISFRTAFFGALVERSAFAALYALHVVVFACGVWAVYTGQMTLGTLVAFEALFLSMGEALTYATQFVPRVAAAAGSIRHIHELMDRAPSAPDVAGAPALVAAAGALTFERLSFSHGTGRSDAGRFQIREIDLTIPAGARVAVVGASGAGKSTLLALIMRFRDPSSGRLLIDGQDVRQVTRRSYLASIGYVPQEPFLFDATIAENIALGGEARERAQVIRAAEQAEIDTFVRSLPAGYDTKVGALGGALSVGQRQRLAIARALVRDPAILILDEPTSALDPETEASLNATLWKIASNRTLICATHKLAGVTPFADQVIVLEDGRVIESGHHAHVLARGGLYARLWRTQTEQGRPASPDAGVTVTPGDVIPPPASTTRRPS